MKAKEENSIEPDPNQFMEVVGDQTMTGSWEKVIDPNDRENQEQNESNLEQEGGPNESILA